MIGSAGRSPPAPRQVHLLGRDRLGARTREIARFGRHRPLAQRLFHLAAFLGGHDESHTAALNSAVYWGFAIFFTSRPSGLEAVHRPLEAEERWAAHTAVMT